eukprot:scaffold11054_cov136-Isochrysis_galbana.AAC.1
MGVLLGRCFRGCAECRKILVQAPSPAPVGCPQIVESMDCRSSSESAGGSRALYSAFRQILLR